MKPPAGCINNRRLTLNKPILFLTGLGTIVFGIGILLKPKFYIHAQFYDFTKLKWPVGLFFVFFGVILVCLGLIRKSKHHNGDILICPKCQDPYKKENLNQRRCLACGVELEELEGFFERHPELRKIEQKEDKVAE
jgi:hypothetical protein